MTSRHFFWIIASALVSGWFAADLSVVKTSDPVDSLSVIETESGKPEPTFSATSWDTGQTVLKRQRDGHFYAKVTVDYADYRFLVDTGATIVALTGDDAQAMGLYWDDHSLRKIGRGASGPVYGVPVTIPRMEMGGIEARDVQAAIVPEGLGISLLGQSFLSKIKNVSISGDEMRLGE